MRGSSPGPQAIDRLLPALAAAGLAIAAYLAWTKLAGAVPACGPLRGCETVNTSPYSEIAGIPVAVIGVAYSAVILVASLRWLGLDGPRRWHPISSRREAGARVRDHASEHRPDATPVQCRPGAG